MTPAAFDAQVRLRAWGTDDPRVLPPLIEENQPGATLRAQAVRDRAYDAGWPTQPNPGHPSPDPLRHWRRTHHQGRHRG